MSTPAEKNAKVLAVLQAEQKPIGPTEIARRINEPWCCDDGFAMSAPITPILHRIVGLFTR